jgi:hypothetical protein
MVTVMCRFDEKFMNLVINQADRLKAEDCKENTMHDPTNRTAFEMGAMEALALISFEDGSFPSSFNLQTSAFILNT